MILLIASLLMALTTPVAIDAANSAIQVEHAIYPGGEYGGALYFADAENDTEYYTVYKSTDGGETWALQDAANAPGSPWSNDDTAFTDGVFHVLIRNSSTGRIDYITFNCATDSYGTRLYGSAGNNSPANAGDGIQFVIPRDDGTFWVGFADDGVSPAVLYIVPFDGADFGTPVDIHAGPAEASTHDAAAWGYRYDSDADELRLLLSYSVFGQPKPVYYRRFDGAAGTASLFLSDISVASGDNFYNSASIAKFNGKIAVAYVKKSSDSPGDNSVYIARSDVSDGDSPSWTHDEVARDVFDGERDHPADIESTAHLGVGGGTLYCWFLAYSHWDGTPPGYADSLDGNAIAFITTADVVTWAAPVVVYDWIDDPAYADTDWLNSNMAVFVGDGGFHLFMDTGEDADGYNQHTLYFGPGATAITYAYFGQPIAAINSNEFGIYAH